MLSLHTPPLVPPPAAAATSASGHRLALASSHACLCSVDASTCALLSEDYPATTRWHLQRELVACHSQACLGGGLGDLPAASSERRQVVLVAGSSGRASVALHPTAEVAALQQALDGLQPAGESNLLAALKLALVRPACARQFHAASIHSPLLPLLPGRLTCRASAALETSVRLPHSASAGACPTKRCCLPCPPCVPCCSW